MVAACGDDSFEFEGIPGDPVPARLDGWVPSVDIAIDMTPPGNFLVDTGAPLSMLDTDSYPDYEDGLHEVMLDGFGIIVPAHSLAAFDVFSYAQDPTTAYDGIIGGDLLRHFSLTVDYKGERLWLHEDLDGGVPAEVDLGGIEAPISVGTEVQGGGTGLVPGECPDGCGTIGIGATRVLVEVALEGGSETVTLLVDTGASAVVLTEDIVATLGDPDRPRLDGVTVGTANGAVTAYFTRVTSLRLGEAEHTSVSVLVLPDADLFASLADEVGKPVHGLVGGSFLRNFLVSIDYPREALTLSRYRSPTHLDADEFVRVGFSLATDDTGDWIVEDVYANTDAAAQGLLSGEMIASIDGEDVAGATSSAVSSLLGRFALGEQVPVGVTRGVGVDVLMIEVENLLPEYVAQ